MKFPFVTPTENLIAIDFHRFELQFIRTVIDFFPCSSVDFIDEEAEGSLPEQKKSSQSQTKNLDYPETWIAGAGMVRAQRQPVVDPASGVLFLPIWNGKELAAVAVLSGGNQAILSQYTLDWLQERSRWVSREFKKIKQWSHDSVSGLLNGAHLQEELTILLNSLDADDAETVEGRDCPLEWHLFLIEVAYRANNADLALQDIGRTGAYLDSLIGELAYAHHLGLGVYGLIWPGKDSEEAQRLGYAVLRKLKRQNIAKVHVGIAPLASELKTGAQESQSELLLAKAWEALNTSRQRGTFSLCIYSEKDTENHPLSPIPSTIMAQLQKSWRRENQFSLVLVQKDLANKDTFPARVIALAGDVMALPINGHEAYLLMTGMDEVQVMQWIDCYKKKIDSLGIGSFSMGAAVYPCPGFKKADIPLNARKALIHTNYFGPGSATLFDGISLNISGDIYYNEGDTVQAINEYRLGLNLDPENINLLNSLAVIYAQIDQYKKAIPLFERALALEPKDFMALYNLGSAHFRLENMEGALLYFEKALAVDNNYFDLLFQLGQIYCQAKKYKKALHVLIKAEKNGLASCSAKNSQPWERDESGRSAELGHGQVYRYLGIAYYGIGKNKEAITNLQRASRYNSRDAESLSLLGRLYAVEKEGMEIARSLCQQAVDIEGDRSIHWYCLAFVLFVQKEYAEARNALQHCLKLTPKDVEALMLMAQVHEKLRSKVQARKFYEKVLRLDGTNKVAVRRMKLIVTK